MEIELEYLALYFLTGTFLLYLLKKYMSGLNFDTSKYSLRQKYAVVTGGNSGIGKQTVIQLAKLNCNIIIGARDTSKSQQVCNQVLEILQKRGSAFKPIIQYYQLDLGSKKSIQKFAQHVSSQFPKIDYLINNAGLSLMPTKKVTDDGFQMSYGVNHLGHFYLTKLLFESLQKSQYFRIINISSIAHRRLLGFFVKTTLDWQNINFIKQNSYEQNLAYSRSKLYNILFTRSLAKKIPVEKGICVSLHPGVVRSDILRHQKFMQILLIFVHPIYWLFTKSNKQGAQTTLYTILSQDLESGQFYSDCQKSSISELALEQQNANKLWQISQRDLNVKFQVKF